MHSLRLASSRHRLAGAFATAAVSVVIPAGAHAAPLVNELRVEGSDATLAPAVSYVHDTATIQTDTRTVCGGTGGTKALNGPTALGLLAYASRTDDSLRPLGVSDRFSFGLLVCAIDRYVSSDTAFWLYKVNHVSPEVGADQFAMKAGDSALWYFLDTAAGRNTGRELELVAPVRARRGRTFEVTVYARSASGARSPAAGAEVEGESVQLTNAQGRARIHVDHDATVRLRATRGADIPSATVPVCVNAALSRCSPRRGSQIVGTSGRDNIVGTLGPDLVRAGDGRDRINVRDTERDTVRCGEGIDRVRADRLDRLSGDCEERFRR